MKTQSCRRVLSLAVVAMSLLATDLAGQTRGTFDAADEAQIWQTRPAWGRSPLRCLDVDGDGYPERFDHAAPALCPPEAPLADDELYLPVGMAVYDPAPTASDRLTRYRLYVADWANHRIAVFDGTGRALPPIGSGGGEGLSEFGEVGPPYSDGVEYPEGRLLFPEGVAVDSAGEIVVADTYNGRLQVFRPDGTLRFVVKLPVTTRPRGERAWPSQVAVRAGTRFRTPPSTCSGQPGSARILVSTFAPAALEPPHDGLHQVLAYDDRFCLTGTIGEPNPEGSLDVPGTFALPSGLGFDEDSRLVVSDALQSRVYVLPRPATGDTVPEPLVTIENAFHWPYGATFDRNGRVFVADTFNHRVAAFEPDYDAERTRFLFDVKGDTLAYPQSVAADNLGRYFVTTLDGIHVFELPRLAVYDESSSRGAVRAGETFDVQFSIVVPPGAAGVDDVQPTITATGPVTRVSGPTVVVGQTPPLDLDAGDFVTFRYRYRATTSSGNVATFTLGARNTSSSIVAPPKTVTVNRLCSSCENVGPNAVATAAPQDEGSIEITIQTSDASTGGSGVRAILAAFTGAEARRQPGTLTFENTSDADPFMATITVSEPGSSRLEYWAIDTLGNVGPRRSLTVSLDLSPPDVRFSFRTQRTGVGPDGRFWWNAPVTMDVRPSDDITDDDDVEFLEGGRVIRFDRNGTEQVQTVRVADEAGNEATFHTHQANRGGRMVNIDSVVPITILAEAPGFYLGPVTLHFAASDSLSGVREVRASLNGGTANVVSGGTLTIAATSTVRFYAVDYAGNVEPSQTAVFTINRPPTAASDFIFTSPGQVQVVDVLRNDRDPDGDAITLVSASPAENGTTSLVGNSVRYQPAPGFTGFDRFTYVVRDAHGAVSTGSVVVIVWD